MNKTNSVIEVNGNRYDAVTGRLVSAGRKTARTTQSSGKKMIDGFVVGAHHTKTRLQKTTTSLSKPAARTHSKATAQGLHRQPERPKTLIRKGLKKPHNGSVPPSSNTHSRAVNVHPIKEMRAKTVLKHNKVERFGHFSSRKPQVVAATPVRPITSRRAAAGTELPPPPPSMITSVSHHKMERMLDEALLKADAHKHMMNQKRHSGIVRKLVLLPKWLSFSVVGFVLAAIVAFLVWQNLPAVAVHVAAAKAHVNASMPGYTPSGFAYVGPLKYSSGAITMQFKDKVNAAQQFSLTQKASNWSSSSLAANALPDDKNVQTSEVNGTTVYIYGEDNDATWVNHSVQYTLKNKANLTSDQVLRIVQGL